MATEVDWATQVITVYQADLIQIQSTPIAIYQLDVNTFHEELRALEDDPLGMPWPDTHTYRAPVTLSGVTYARLMEIINGYTVTFSPDASYAVQIVGGNSNIGDRVNPNNVSVQVANSAGLQDSASLQAGSFLGHVTIDVNSPYTGTIFPIGTQGFPVNNIIDAHDIAEERGLSRFLVQSSMTLASETLADGYTFFSEKTGVILTIDSSADVTNCSFAEMEVTGVLDSNNQFTRCDLYAATSLQAELFECGIRGTITLAGNGLTQLINCYSDVAGGGAGQYANIDMGVSGNSLLVRGYSGGLGIQNLNDPSADISLDFESGRCTFYPSVTDGPVTVRGVCDVIDNSTGTAVINDDTINKAIDDTSAQIIPHIWAKP